jgi:hypothetical protein
MPDLVFVNLFAFEYIWDGDHLPLNNKQSIMY